jgi:hypothetical protein
LTKTFFLGRCGFFGVVNHFFNVSLTEEDT